MFRHPMTPTTWVTLQTIAEQGIGILLFAVQAAVLGPHAFGVFSLVMVFIGFCEFILSTAASEALISILDIEDRHYHAMTTANVVLAIALGLTVFLGADTLAQLFNEPQLGPVMRWMAALPVISALCAAPLAASKRELRFRPIAIRAIAGLLAGATVGLVLALAGAGVWALVVQAIVQRSVSAIVLWAAVPLRLQFSVSSRHLRELQRFAATLMFSRTMNWASAQVPRLALGLYLGATELGIFTLAARLSDILFQVTLEPRIQIARLELRRFAGNQAGLNQAMTALFTQISVFCFPLCVGAASVAPLLFHTWLKPHWFEGIVPAQLLLLMAVPCITLYCASALLLALNHQKWEALISTVQTISIIAAVIVFARFGLLVACAAIALRPLLLLPLPIMIMNRLCHLPLALMLRTQLPALTVSLIMGSAVALLGPFFERALGSATSLLLLSILGAGFYVVVITLWLPAFCWPLIHRLGRQRWFFRWLPSV